jgi:predicted RNA-binding protein with PIN domain
LTADPVVPPPPALRPYLTFSRLNTRSLDAVARVVDRDDEFRARVAAAVSEEQVGRAGWLWLARPDGWADELAELESAWAAQQADEAGERDERTAIRKLAAAQAAAARAEADTRARLVELDEARGDLARERAARAAAEARVAELEAQVEGAVVARAEVVRNLKETESRLVARATELNAAKARLRDLAAEAAGRATEPEPAERGAAAGGEAEPDPGQRGSGVEAASGAGREVGAGREAAPSLGGPGPGQRGGAATRPSTGSAPAPRGDPPRPPASTHLDRTPAVAAGADVAGQVARAAEGAAALADALAALAQTLGGPARGPLPCAADGEGERPPGVGDAAGVGALGADGDTGPRDRAGDDDATGAGPAPGASARRVPVRLPGGMFDDTVEAAEHLLRTPEAVLVVDGYNVTMQGWPELAVAAQRRRLVTALSDLAARTATRVELVFDGAEVEPRSVPAPSRQLVRVRFSEPGVEADDVVIDLVGRIPAATPVIVASSDRRVREGARRGGANLLHARQLVAILRR